MRRIAGLLAVLVLLGAAAARAALVTGNGGATVTDTSTGIVWLQNFNLAASNAFGVKACGNGVTSDCVNASGSMDLKAAEDFINGLNNYNNRQGYLNHTNWQLPATSPVPLNSGCTATGPNGSPFGFGCTNTALGSIYATLGGVAPARLGPATSITDGPFFNLQPNLYWSGSQETSNPAITNGYRVFSLSSGWQGSEVGVNRLPAVGGNYDYVLPMTPGRLPGLPPVTGTALVYDPGTQTVYDPVNNVTWIANGNLAASMSFGMPSCSGIAGTAPCIGPGGSMNWTSANAFVTQYMDHDGPQGYLGVSTWELPLIPTVDAACNKQQVNSLNHPFSYGFGCAGTTEPADPSQYNPLGYLFYNQLTGPSGNPLTAGDSIAGTLQNTVGPFSNLQPYYYWQCGASNSADALTSTCDYKLTPNGGFGWSYSFDDGFQSTDVNINDFYVAAEYVSEPGTLALLLAALAGLTLAQKRALLRRRDRV